MESTFSKAFVNRPVAISNLIVEKTQNEDPSCEILASEINETKVIDTIDNCEKTILCSRDDGKIKELVADGRKVDNREVRRATASVHLDRNTNDAAVKKNETKNERISLPNFNFPTLKREKSLTGSTERKKKRVKFNSHEDKDEVLIQTCVYEPVNPLEALLQETDVIGNTPLACKLKRLLINKSKALEKKTEKYFESTTTEEIVRNVKPYDVSDDITFIDDGENSDDDAEKNKIINLGLIDKSNNMEHKNLKSNTLIESSESFPIIGQLKREATFTLEGRPPAKSLKSSTSLEQIFGGDITNKENENFEIYEIKSENANSDDINLNNSRVDCSDEIEKDEMNHCASNSNTSNPIVVNKPPQLRSRRDAIELKVDSLASKRRARVNVEKPLQNEINDKILQGQNEVTVREKSKSPSFRDSARKTLNAWKSAVKGSLRCDQLDKSSPKVIHSNDKKETLKFCNEKSLYDSGYQSEPDADVEDSTDLNQGDKLNSASSITRSKMRELIPKAQTADPQNSSTSAPSANGRRKIPIVGTVHPLRRDGALTKTSVRWSRAFDSDKSKLEAELRKITSERDR